MTAEHTEYCHASCNTTLAVQHDCGSRCTCAGRTCEKGEADLQRRCSECGHSWLQHHNFDYGSLQYYATGCDHWSQCICKRWRDTA